MKKNLSWIPEALVSSAYSASTFERGITIEDYRERLSHHGEQIRWWKGYEKTGPSQEYSAPEVDDGDTFYVEQALSSDTRILFSRAQQPLFTLDFEPVADACAAITFAPAEVDLAEGDVIVRLQRPALHRCAIEPLGGSVDALPHRFIASIERVFDSSGEFSPDMYEVHEYGLRWRTNPPSSTVFVEYHSYCAFEFLGLIENTLPMPNDDYFQMGALRLFTEGLSR